MGKKQQQSLACYPPFWPTSMVHDIVQQVFRVKFYAPKPEPKTTFEHDVPEVKLIYQQDSPSILDL